MDRNADAEAAGIGRLTRNGGRAYGRFERLAALAAHASGSSVTFLVAVSAVVLWALSGPFFGYSQGWQLVINTGTTIVTFLMVFLIQHAQNKDSRAVHLKLNELIASHEYASNRLVAIEDLDEASLRRLHAFYCQLAELAEREGGLKVSHSADEAEQVHSRKQRARQARDVAQSGGGVGERGDEGAGERAGAGSAGERDGEGAGKHGGEGAAGERAGESEAATGGALA